MNRKSETVLPSSVLIFIEKKNHMSKKRKSRPLSHPGPTFSSLNNRVEFFRFDQNRNGANTLVQYPNSELKQFTQFKRSSYL